MRLLCNAHIYTFNPDQPTASALAIDDHAPHQGRILALGDDDLMRSEFGGRAELEDLGGRVVIPGLTDSHLHLKLFALDLQKLDCAAPTRQECLRRVAEQAGSAPPGAWIQGHGWNQNEWAEGFGSAADLDAAAPDNPVYLTAASLHAAWANSAALKAAGVTAKTPDPPKGAIQHDESGEPTGILFEGAMELVSGAIPHPSPHEVAEAIEKAQTYLWRVGLTGVHDFDRRHSFVALQLLHARGELKLRVVKNLPVEDLEYAVGLGLRSGFGDDLLRLGSVKVFMDGALGPHTAAMFEPYQDEPDNRGMLFYDGEELFERARLAASAGLSMTVHAIGDRANHEVLQAFAQLRDFERAEGLPPLRHRIEHVQLLPPDDVGRLAELDVIASMQPIHAVSDMAAADKYWGARAEYSYAWRALLKRGTRLAFGSDAPVETPNPFWGLHAAVTRRRADGSPGPEGWYGEQRLTVDEALRAYTQGAAYAAGVEDRLGTLASGFLADLLVLDSDPFTCPPEELRQILPQATMLGGDWVWRG